MSEIFAATASGYAAGELARELENMRLLQELSSQLIAEQRVESLYEMIAAAAAALMRSNFSSMQMLYPERNGRELRLLASRGFTAEAVRRWEWVGCDATSTCGAALRARQRVMIHDIDECDFMAGTANLTVYRNTGIKSAQSTPLFSRDGQVVGMLSTHWSVVHVPADRDFALFDILARQAADLVQHRRSDEQLREAQLILERRVIDRTREVRDLLGRLVAGLEDERCRIARDIHDQVGQQLTALRMNIELLVAEPSVEQASRTQQLAASLDRTIDSLAWEIRPPELEALGLAAALESLIDEWSSRSGTTAVCDVESLGRVQLGVAVEANIYRIVQEALHNVSKHARASQVRVTFERRLHRDVFTIRDDGVGFAAATPTAADEHHLGVVNMRERATLIGGTLQIDSNAAGTVVRVEIERASPTYVATS